MTGSLSGSQRPFGGGARAFGRVIRLVSHERRVSRLDIVA